MFLGAQDLLVAVRSPQPPGRAEVPTLGPHYMAAKARNVGALASQEATALRDDRGCWRMPVTCGRPAA